MISLEFHTSHIQVKPMILDRIRKDLTRLHHRYPSISYVEIYFKKRHNINRDEKVCEMDLSLLGEHIYIQQAAASFEQASELASTVLEKIAFEKLNHHRKLIIKTEKQH